MKTAKHVNVRIVVCIFVVIIIVGIAFVRFDNYNSINTKIQNENNKSDPSNVESFNQVLPSSILETPIVVFSSSSSSSFDITPRWSFAQTHVIKKFNKLWKPTTCGSLWNMSNFPRNEMHFAELDAVNFNVRNGRRIVPDARFNISADDRCVSYDSGVFVPIQQNMSLSTEEEIFQKCTIAKLVAVPVDGPRKFEVRRRTELPPSWKHARPNTYLIQGSGNYNNERRLPELSRQNILGFNLAAFIAKKLRGRENLALSSSSPWILMIGDSRVRQIFMRLISMIRSEFIPSAAKSSLSSKNEIADDSFYQQYANGERLREGVFEHYFHGNATYTVFGYITRTNPQYHPTSDRLRILPEGKNCDHDDAEFPTSSSSKQVQVLFRICFWWHTRTEKLLTEAQDLVVRRLKNEVASIMWMPTLHECEGKNRKMLDDGKNHVCGTSPIELTKMTTSFLELMQTHGSETKKKQNFLRNIVLLTSPLTYTDHNQTQLQERQDALIAGLRQYQKKHGINLLQFNKSNATLHNGNSVKNISVKRDQNIWFIDQGYWWNQLDEANKLLLCDMIHSMCVMRPLRPARAKEVAVFCDGCKDEVGFVLIEELLRVIL